MPREMTRIVADLRSIIDRLVTQRDKARLQCEDLASKVQSLEDQLQQCRRDLADARMQVDFLTVSHHAETPDNLIQARRRVQRLIAKIDKCVALIKDDADIN